MARPSWDSYFMDMAAKAASRATCGRRKVGTVIVRNNLVLATGYNGSPPGQPHCDDVGHQLEADENGGSRCVRTIHSEANAVMIGLALHGDLSGSTVYCTCLPCLDCAKLLLSARVSTVVYAMEASDHRGLAALINGSVRVLYKPFEGEVVWKTSLS